MSNTQRSSFLEQEPVVAPLFLLFLFLILEAFPSIDLHLDQSPAHKPPQCGCLVQLYNLHDYCVTATKFFAYEVRLGGEKNEEDPLVRT